MSTTVVNNDQIRESSKVKISSNDTTGGYLSDKLQNGTGISLSVNAEGGNETITITNSGMTIPSNSVGQSQLKTSYGEVGGSMGTYYLPGGEYGFYPQVAGTSTVPIYASISGFYELAGGGDEQRGVGSAAYVTTISLACREMALFYNAYAKQRYVTSSGEVFWIFFLRDKKTKAVIATWASPDHPCMGNGGKPLVISHPFPGYNPEKHEIIVVNPDESQLQELRSKMEEPDESLPDLSLLQVIIEKYKIDEKGGSPDWPIKDVTVGLPPGVDWRRTPDGTLVTPIKKIIPKPEYIKTKALTSK